MPVVLAPPANQELGILRIGSEAADVEIVTQVVEADETVDPSSDDVARRETEQIGHGVRRPFTHRVARGEDDDVRRELRHQLESLVGCVKLVR